MLRIFVVSHNGIPPKSPMVACFGDAEGGIGRDETNTLVLPGRDKHLSRVQALVKCLGGEYFLVDQGGNPSIVNGRPLGKGSVASLHSGDRIAMAGWVLQVEELPENAVQNPGTSRGKDRAVSPQQHPMPRSGVPVQAGIGLSAWGNPTGLEDLPEKRSAQLGDIQVGLFKGLGISCPEGWTLDARQAEKLGELLRASMEGFLRLLKENSLSRSKIEASGKTEPGLPRNPLRTSADSAIALRQMLFESSPGNQMPPLLAIHDAIDGLHAHHAGLFLGLRAAVAGMLEHFQPEHLVAHMPDTPEQKAEPTGVREWATYMEDYDQIAREAQESFHAELARVFDRVYEDRMQRRRAGRALF